MEHIRMHIDEKKPRRPGVGVPTGASGKSKATERGELMEYFLTRLNAARVRDGLAPMTMGRMGRLLVGIPTQDLYYLKSICDHAKDFSKKFWWEINPKNHTESALAQRQQQFAQQSKKKRYE